MKQNGWIVECWVGSGAMIFAKGFLWNHYNSRPGTVFLSRKSARQAVKDTEKHSGRGTYQIQRVEWDA